jgi:hypothetical protein
MKENTARDLFALAAHAFNRKDYDTAGQLITLSLSNPDAPAFIDSLLLDNHSCGVLSESISSSVDDLEDVSKTVSKSISSAAKQARRKQLRSDDEDFDDVMSQSFDMDDAETENLESESSKNFLKVSSPLRIKLK